MADRGRPPRARRNPRKPIRKPSEPPRPGLELPDAVATELRSTARPGKGDVLVDVFSQAAAAFAEGRYEDAIRLGDQAKHIALRAASVRELLGLSYYRAGRYKEAAKELSAFRRISGSTEQNPIIADCYRAAGRPERAVELCDEIDPRVGPAIFYEGQIVAAGALADMGRLDEAIARLESLELRPEVAREHHVRAWYALADALEHRGRFTAAREWFEAAAAADPELTDAPERVRRLGRKAR